MAKKTTKKKPPLSVSKGKVNIHLTPAAEELKALIKALNQAEKKTPKKSTTILRHKLQTALEALNDECEKQQTAFF